MREKDQCLSSSTLLDKINFNDFQRREIRLMLENSGK